MSTTYTDEAPRLVVVSPGSDQGRQVVLTRPQALVGRSVECDIRFDDPHVSRRHASLVHRGGTVYVQDLDSTSGTYVNGVRVGGPHVLWPGDVVSFAGVELRLGPELGSPAAAAPAATSWTGARYDVGSQSAGTINNVGRDQHNSYVQHVVQQRESFLRQVAATKTKARWLVWLGLVLTVVGMVLFASGPLQDMGAMSDAARTNGDPALHSNGLQLILGFFVGFAGNVLLVVGIVLHVVAASRRRRVESRYAVPQQSWGA